MKFQHTQTIAFVLLSASTVFVQANNKDRFNYGNTDEDDKDYGPEDWNEVSCDDPGNCVSISMKGYILATKSLATILHRLVLFFLCQTGGIP